MNSKTDAVLMSLTVMKWLGFIGISLVAAEYCGAKLFPEWRRFFEKAACFTVFAANAVLLWLYLVAIDAHLPFLESLKDVGVNIADNLRRTFLCIL